MDYPRFDRIQGDRENLHLAYHGGAAVELVLRFVDRWLIKRPAAPLSTVLTPTGPTIAPDLLATSQQNGVNHA